MVFEKITGIQTEFLKSHVCPHQLTELAGGLEYNDKKDLINTMSKSLLEQLEAIFKKSMTPEIERLNMTPYTLARLSTAKIVERVQSFVKDNAASLFPLHTA